MTTPGVDIAGKFVGPLFVGTLFNVALFGICLMQAHTYYQHCKNDARWIKWMVAWLILMEATSSALASFVAYDYAIRDFGNPTKVLIRTPEFSAFLLIIGINSATAQAFYAWRIKRLFGKNWLAYLIWVAAGAQLLCVTGVAAGDSIVRSYLEYQRAKAIRTLVIGWMTLATLTDLLITALLVWFLRKSRTGFKKTDAMLNKLALLTVQTGAITAFFAFIGLLMFLTIVSFVKPPDFVHLIFIFTLPEFYGVCLMSSLNSRSRWQTELGGQQTLPTTRSSFGNMIGGTGTGTGTGKSRGDFTATSAQLENVVHITTSVIMHSDSNFELADSSAFMGNLKEEGTITTDDPDPGHQWCNHSYVSASGESAIGPDRDHRDQDEDVKITPLIGVYNNNNNEEGVDNFDIVNLSRHYRKTTSTRGCSCRDDGSGNGDDDDVEAGLGPSTQVTFESEHVRSPQPPPAAQPRL